MGHSTRKYINKAFGIEFHPPYEVWFDEKFKDKIGIDAANCHEDGRMACLRLDDMEVFYIE